MILDDVAVSLTIIERKYIVSKFKTELMKIQDEIHREKDPRWKERGEEIATIYQSIIDKVCV